MVLYQLESIHLDDSNLISCQNKNRGFTEILTAFPLLYNMILMPSIQILFFSNQFQCIIPQFHKSLTNFNISYKIQHQTLTIHSLDFFFSNPNLIHFFLNFYQIHHDSTLNTLIGVLSTKPQQIKGLCDLSTKTLGLEQTNLQRKTLEIIPITLDIQKTFDSIQKKKKKNLCSSPSSSSSSSSLLLPFLVHTSALAFVRQKMRLFVGLPILNIQIFPLTISQEFPFNLFYFYFGISSSQTFHINSCNFYYGPSLLIL